jgi:hypothetical protein
MALALCALSGCSDASGSRDGGLAGDADASGMVLHVDMRPCPSGWSETELANGSVVCEPYPEGRSTCAADEEAHFPGEPGCRAVGRACPAGDFRDDLPSDVPVVFVLPGATGTGTRADPLGSLTEAMAGAEDGSVLALGRGTHTDLPTTWNRSVRLIGACPSATVLDVAETVEVSAAEMGLSDLTVTGAAIPPLRIVGETHAVIEGAVFRDVYDGIETNHPDGMIPPTTIDLEVRDVVFRRIECFAILTAHPTTLSLSGVAFEDAWMIGDLLYAEARIENSTGMRSSGPQVKHEANVEIVDSVFEEPEVGPTNRGWPAEMRLSQVVVRGGDRAVGHGVGVWPRSTLVADRVRVEGMRGVGVFVRGEEGVDEPRVQLSNLAIAGTAPYDCTVITCPEGSPAGHGLGVYARETELTGFVIDESEACGFQFAQNGTLDVASGLVTGNEIGACVQVDGYDLSRLQTGVVYRDNGTNLASTTLPVPEPVAF